MSWPKLIACSPTLHRSAVENIQFCLSFARKSVHLSMSYSDVRVQPRFLRRMTNFWSPISIVSDAARLLHNVLRMNPKHTPEEARPPDPINITPTIRATTATATWIKRARGLDRKVTRIAPGSATMSISALSPNVILDKTDFVLLSVLSQGHVSRHAKCNQKGCR